MMLDICIKFREVSQRASEFLSGHGKYKGETFRKNVGRVTVLVFAHCMIILYIYIKFLKIPLTVLKRQSQHHSQSEKHKEFHKKI